VTTTTAYSAAAHLQVQLRCSSRYLSAFLGTIGLRRFPSLRVRFAPPCAVGITRFFAARASSVYVRSDSRFLPRPDPLHLSAEKASRSATSSDVSCRPNSRRRASTLTVWPRCFSEESRRDRCPCQDRSSRMPVKAHEAHDPKRLRLAPSRPLGRKWLLNHTTRAGFTSNRNTLSPSAATRPSR
jgi:hypothetical protein